MIPYGRFWVIPEEYLAENPPLIATERLAGPNTFGPLIDDGRIAISSTDLQIYITKTGTPNLSVTRVAAMISAVGGNSVRIRKGGFREQSRWALPVNDWDPKDYSSDAGELGNGG